MELIIIFISIFITGFASILLRIIYSKYKSVDVNSKYNGLKTAQKILKSNDLDNIEIGKVNGSLSDYYNDSNKEVMLSEYIYEESSIASVAVAAHECGHALQYKSGYFPIKLRNVIVPFVNIGNKIGYIAIIISLFASLSKLFLLGICLISFAIIFQLITLPVEINASKRGKKELIKLGIITKEEKFGVSVMLYAAAFTYLAGLISSVLEIVRLIYIFNNRD